MTLGLLSSRYPTRNSAVLQLRPPPTKSIGERLLEAGHPISIATPGDPTTITRIYPDGRWEIGRWKTRRTNSNHANPLHLR